MNFNFKGTIFILQAYCPVIFVSLPNSLSFAILHNGCVYETLGIAGDLPVKLHRT